MVNECCNKDSLSRSMRRLRLSQRASVVFRDLSGSNTTETLNIGVSNSIRPTSKVLCRGYRSKLQNVASERLGSAEIQGVQYLSSEYYTFLSILNLFQLNLNTVFFKQNFF